MQIHYETQVSSPFSRIDEGSGKLIPVLYIIGTSAPLPVQTVRPSVIPVVTGTGLYQTYPLIEVHSVFIQIGIKCIKYLHYRPWRLNGRQRRWLLRKQKQFLCNLWIIQIKCNHKLNKSQIEVNEYLFERFYRKCLCLSCSQWWDSSIACLWIDFDTRLSPFSLLFEAL